LRPHRSGSYLNVHRYALGDRLGLEAVDERLGERVVKGVADRCDRGDG
jgi:hypothetical protein